jgi:hypothetical protein
LCVFVFSYVLFHIVYIHVFLLFFAVSNRC